MSPNQYTCPLCHQTNACGLNQMSSKACWCESLSLPEKTPELNEKLEELQGNMVSFSELGQSQSCICQACLTKLNHLSKGLITR
ncbi:hypothetical protein OA92_03325 [Marinomonas sp. SBI22]|uniref:cysteine-rich CWC family protein n=1 Tax=unclassified Marinomonas TaxID=196814 RepID=UPI0007AEEE6B|nr:MULTISPECIES: cysteine-rich CWC family protein [unclassified Marinomonas]KZM44908.1 hypothetical protein OA92_03325 [Marinomonas sp. SBI22]KZM46607.1 hypothetical protein OA91_02385 [Marinomonas sp. SBI8L]